MICSEYDEYGGSATTCGDIFPLVTALIAHLAHPVIGGGDDECDKSMMVKIMNKMDILNKSSDICF